MESRYYWLAWWSDAAQYNSKMPGRTLLLCSCIYVRDVRIDVDMQLLWGVIWREDATVRSDDL